MTFNQAAELCFAKLKLLLLAIEMKNEDGVMKGGKSTKILINPRGVKIVSNTVGFFIANDAEEVRRANAFCKACHEDIKDPNLIRKCKCKNFVSGLLAHSVIKSQQMATGIAGKPLNGVTQNGKAKSPTPRGGAPGPPVNVPPPPCAPYCPLPGQLKIEK